MFEQGLSFVLKKLLRDFVEDGDNLHEKVQVGVWSGLIVLENLVLKNSIFNLLEVPVALSYGYIGRLELHIPWSRLGYEPVTIVLDKIYLLVEPKYEWHPGAQERREQAVKQAKLAAAELFASQRLQDNSSNGSYTGLAKNWFLGALLSKIVDKIQITIRELHIRYEDKMSCPTEFCVGISFESLHVLSRDQNGNNDEESTPTRPGSNMDTTRNYDSELQISGSDAWYKLVELNHLAVYWNPLQSKGLDACSCMFIGRSPREIQALMSRTVVSRVYKSYERPRHHYVLNPVDIKAFLDVSVNLNTGLTKAKVKVFVSDISICLEDKQLREIISVALNMANFAKLERFSQYRPQHGVIGNAVAWWSYAINAILAEIRIEKKKRLSLSQFTKRSNDKLVYIELWRSRLISPASIVNQIGQFSNSIPFLEREKSPLYQSLLKTARKRKLQEKLQRALVSDNKSVQSFTSQASGRDDENSTSFEHIAVFPLDTDKVLLLQQLEGDLSFEDILYFRSLAELSSPNDIRKETWFGSLVGWATGKQVNHADEERGKLLEALKYDPDNLFRGGTAKVDPNEVVNIVDVYLKEGSVTLSLSAPNASSTFQAAIPFLQLKLEDLRLKTIGMGDGSHLKVYFSLQDFDGFELQPSNMSQKKALGELIHHRFIFRRTLKVEKSITAGSESNYSLSEDRSVNSQSKMRGLSLMPLFSSIIEAFPAGNEVEVSVRLDLEELEVWFSPSAKWIDSVVLFSTWPEDLKYWSEMEMKAMNQFEDIKLRLNAKLDYIMNNHSNVVIEGRLQAPILVIHDHQTGVACKANILVVDLGMLTLHTQKLAKAQRSKDLLALSHMQASNINASTYMNNSTSMPIASQENGPSISGHNVDKGWEMLTSDRLHNSGMDTLNLVPKDLDLLFAGVQTEENQSVVDNPLGTGRRSSIFHKYGEQPGGLLPENFEFDSQEEELFDIFICKISHIEVYFVEVLVNVSLDGKWNVQYELDKTIMVERFEINIEIQVSALPWDITLPPVKLFVDIPEINIELSDAKILRVVQFAAQMARQSQAILDANKEKNARLKPFRAAKSNEMPVNQAQSKLQSGESKQAVDSSRQQLISRRLRRRKARGRSMGDNASLMSDIKSTYTSNTALTSKSRRQLSNINVAESKNDENDEPFDESDDESFFSVENNDNFQDSAKTLEELKYIIGQRESMQTKLLTDLRLTELDPSKVMVQENLKKELAVCEMELHQLKVSYVEMLMSNADYLSTFEDDVHNNEMKESAYNAGSFKARVESMLSPEFMTKDSTMSTRKRDLVQASAFKLPSNHTISETAEDNGPNKELLYLRVNVSQVNIDLLCGADYDKEGAGSKSPTSAFLSHRSSSFEARLGLSNFAVKLRHRAQDTQISTQLRDLTFSEQLAPGPKLSGNIKKPLLQGGIPLVSSDPSYFSDFALPVNSRTYSTSGMTDLLKIKHEISYTEKSTDGSLVTSHIMKSSLGYLAVNIDQARLVPMILWAQVLNQLLSDNLPPSPPKLSQPRKNSFEQENDSSSSEPPSFSNLPFINMSLKLECISLSLLQGRQPLLNTTVSATKLQLNMRERDISVALGIVDISAYDLESIVQGRYKPSSGELGSSSMIFGRKVNTSSPLLQSVLRISMDRDFQEVNFKGTIKMAPMALDLKTSLIQSTSKHIIQGPLMPIIADTKTASYKNQTQKSTPSSATSYTSVSDICRALQMMNGSIQVLENGISVIIQLDDSNPIMKPEVISLSIRSISATVAMGKVNKVAEIECTAKLTGIETFLSGVVIANPIEMNLITLLRGDDPFYTAMAYDRYHSFSAYQPEYFRFLDSNEAQAMVTVSPIQIHLHKEILDRVTCVSNKASIFTDEMNELLCQDSYMDKEPLSNFSMDPIANAISISKVPFRANISLKLFELSIHMEETAYDIMGASAHGSSQSNLNDEHGDYYLGKGLEPAFQQRRFVFSLSNTVLIASIFQRDTEQNPILPSSVMETCFKVGKIAFDDFTTPEEHRAIITCMGDKKGFSMLQTPANNSGMLYQPMDYGEEVHFINGKITLSTDYSLTSTCCISDLQVNCFLPSLTNIIGWVHQNVLGASFRQNEIVKKFTTGNIGPSKHFASDELYAHPSSLPMSPSAEMTPDLSKENNEKALPLSFISMKLFSQILIKSLSLSFELSKLDLVIPFGQSDMKAFLLTFPIYISFIYNQPDLNSIADILQDFSRGNVDILGSTISSPSISLHLLESPIFESTTEEHLSFTRLSRSPRRESRNNFSHSSQFSQKKLLLQTEFQLSFSTYFNCRPWLSKSADEADLLNREWTLAISNSNLYLHSRITIEVNTFELRAYVDYRPFMSFQEEFVIPMQHFIDNITKGGGFIKEEQAGTEGISQLSESAVSHDNKKAEKIVITDLSDFLQYIGALMDLEVCVHVSEAAIIIINDALPQALALMQVSVLDTNIVTTIPSAPTSFYWCILKCHGTMNGSLDSDLTKIKTANSIQECSSPMHGQSTTLLHSIFGSKGVEEVKTEFGKTIATVEPAFIMVQITASAFIEYFNKKLLAVEPLVEPIQIRSSIRILRSSYERHNPVIFLINCGHSTYYEGEYSLLQSLLARIGKNGPKLLAQDPSSSSSIYLPHIAVKFDKINVNITMGLVETCFLCAQSIDLLSGRFSSNRSNAQGNVGSCLIIRNESGVPIKYWSAGASPAVLASNCEEWITAREADTQGSSLQKLVALNKGPIKSISLALAKSDGNESTSHKDIALEGVGFRVINFDGTSSDREKRMSDKNLKRRSRSNTKDRLSMPPPPLVLELSSRDGSKLLVIRSTMRVYNASCNVFYVKLVDSKPSPRQQAMWECLLLPGKGQFVPAELCAIPNTYFIISIRKDHETSLEKLGSAFFPCPPIPGFSDSNFSKDQGASQQAVTLTSLSSQSDTIRRKKLVQEDGSVNVMTYSHWIDFTNNSQPSQSFDSGDIYQILNQYSERVSCNVDIESKGMPFKRQASPTRCMIRDLRIQAPLTIVNLLGTGVTVAVTPELESAGYTGELEKLFEFDQDLQDVVLQNYLRSGEAKEYFCFHARDVVNLSLKYANDGSSSNNKWCKFIRIPSCQDDAQEYPSVFAADIVFKNESILTIQVEVVDKGGCRTINIYAPFWVVSTSFLPLQLQHEVKSSSRAEKYLNGVDALAADQVFEPTKDTQSNSISTQGNESKLNSLPKGIGRARGLNGVILGPEAPIKGLSDVLYSASNQINAISRLQKLHPPPLQMVQYNSQEQLTGFTDNDASIFAAESSGTNYHFNPYKDSMDTWYSLVHCGYTSKEKKTTRVRFRHRGTLWSKSISLENNGMQIMTVDSSHSSSHEAESAGGYTVNSPFFKDGKKLFSFGVSIQSLDPPFHRTQAIVIMDQFNMINMVGQSIEVKQFQQDNIFTMHNNEEVPVWWRPGQQLLQLRLARYGWSWSGKFSVTSEGEFSLRLRNDYDHTVFFVLIYVFRCGPKTTIVFKGGDKISPYRFENHTVETFRIQQKGQSQLTNLLPYHACAYAWDEPLAPQLFTIAVLKNALQAQDDWEEVGVFTFERLEYLQHSKTYEHLVMRVVAQGPTRVFQLYDARLGSSTYQHKTETVLAHKLRWMSSYDNLLTASIEIDGIGLSIVDQMPEELVFLSLQGLSVQHTLSRNKAATTLVIKRLQVDNQLWSTPYPSIIHPLVPLHYEKGSLTRDSIRVEMKQSFDYSGIVFLPELSISIAPFDINVEGTIVAKLVNMAFNCLEAFTEVSTPLQLHNTGKYRFSIYSKRFGLDESFSSYDNLDALSSSPFILGSTSKTLNYRLVQRIHYLLYKFYYTEESPEDEYGSYNSQQNVGKADQWKNYFQDSQSLSRYYMLNILKKFKTEVKTLEPSTKIYFQRFQLSEIRFNLSLNPVINTDSSLATEAAPLIIGALSRVLIAIGSSVAKIDNCPLRFTSLTLEHVFASSKGFGDVIASTYALQAVKQAHMVVLSSELLGNPVQLFQSISDGVWDFFHLPAVGLLTSPEDFAVGALRGSSSLVRNVVASLCATAGHLMNSIQVGLIALGAVDSYPTIVRESNNALGRKAMDANESNGNTDMIVMEKRQTHRPATSLEAFSMGVTGVVMDPIVGFRTDGLRGFVIGCAKGGLGLFARPLYGVLGAGCLTMEQVSFRLLPRYLANQKLRLIRARPPRYFLSPNMPLQIYSADENKGLEILAKLQQGAYRHEEYLWHGKLLNNNSILLTKVRIMLLDENFDLMQIAWQSLVKHILSIEVDYSSSRPSEVDSAQTGYTQNMRVLRNLIEGDSTSTFTQKKDSSLAGFKSKLSGQPLLSLYHLPQSDQNARETAGSAGKDVGLRLGHEKVAFSSHEQLLQLLHKLLRVAPALASADILSYLHAVGIDMDRVLDLSNTAFSSALPSVVKNTGYKNSASIFSASPLPIALGMEGMPPTPVVTRYDEEQSSVHSQDPPAAISRGSSFAMSRSSQDKTQEGKS